MTITPEYRRKWSSRNWMRVSVCGAVYGAKKRAVARGVPFTLPEGYVDTLINLSGGVCALSGLPFQRTTQPGSKHAFSPSLDRVRPELGYVPGNVRLILDGLNSLKSIGTDEELIAVCRAVAERNA